MSSSLGLPANIEALCDVSLAPFTTLGVGGEARLVVWPKSPSELQACVQVAHKNELRFAVLGAGSNTLVEDDGFDGMVIMTSKMCGIRIEGDQVTAEAGIKVQKLISACRSEGLGGIEFLVSVPGTIGGIVANNAGRGQRRKGWVGDFVVSVLAFDPISSSMATVVDCGFSHRHSRFLTTSQIILAVTIRLVRSKPETIDSLLRRRMKFVNRMQDRHLPNAGTVFKAGFRVSCKGLESGGAKFSSLTENWIVTNGNATAGDIERVIRLAEERHLLAGHAAPLLEWQRLPPLGV